MACLTFITDETCEGRRLDRCIASFLPEIHERVLRSCFSRRDVKLDGKRVQPAVIVHAGQKVQVYCMETDCLVPEVVYRDEDVLLVNKPAGISVEEDENGGATLTDLCRRTLGAPTAKACHRLDNQTCGLVLFALNNHALNVLEDVFRERTADKRYICLVKGQPKPPSAECHAYLVKNAAEGTVTVTDRPSDRARPIITAYETLEGGPLSRLQVHLITGRTHQIRAHMAALGHPLLGDDVYGDRSFNREQHTRRLMLCAVSLRLDTAGRLPQLDGRTFEIPCPF